MTRSTYFDLGRSADARPGSESGYAQRFQCGNVVKRLIGTDGNDSAYTRLLDALGAVRLRCDEITLATEERRPGVLEERWKHARVFPYFRATANQKPLTVFLRQRGQSKTGLTKNLPIYTNVEVVEMYAEAFGGTPQP